MPESPLHSLRISSKRLLTHRTSPLVLRNRLLSPGPLVAPWLASSGIEARAIGIEARAIGTALDYISVSFRHKPHK